MTSLRSLVLSMITYLAISPLFGQLCYTTIFPWPGMTKITTNQSALSSPAGEAFWICSGLTVTVVNSAGSLFVCEENVTLIFTNTSGDDVFAKNGSVVVNNSDGAVAVQCDTNQVTLQNNSTGTLTITSHCPGLVYDYTLVGGNTCSGTNELEKRNNPSLFLYPYPNPTKSHFSIDTGNRKNISIRLLNSNGKEVLSISNYHSQDLISVENMQEGLYGVFIESDQDFAVGKITVNNY
jgi:hypothetical protein